MIYVIGFCLKNVQQHSQVVVVFDRLAIESTCLLSIRVVAARRRRR